jgi:uncharacterized protein
MLEISEAQLGSLKAVIANRLPGLEVRAFGSRVTGRAKPYSDLDLVVMTDTPLPAVTLAELRADLEKSDLPFRVDVVEWCELPDTLRAEIRRHSFTVTRQ